MALLAALAACQQAPPPPPAPVVARVPPPPAEAHHPPVHRVVTVAWSFEIGPESCIATAAGGSATLTVAVRRNAAVDLTLAVPEASRITAHSTPSLRFSGPSGAWSLPASGTARHGIAAATGADEESLGRMLILLGGGTLEVALTPPGLPTLLIQAAGPEAQAWSDCARRQMI